MGNLENVSAVNGEAAGSTSKHALQSLPIRCFGFGKSQFQSYPFVSNCWLFPMESSKKPKQTPPQA
jgi:hypothetical protein